MDARRKKQRHESPTVGVEDRQQSGTAAPAIRAARRRGKDMS